MKKIESQNSKLAKEKSKKEANRGITLIALVITIIVLLILVAVSIAALTGENGIITQASDAKIRNQISQIKEEIEVYRTGKYLEEKTGVEAYPIAIDEEGNKQSILDILNQEEINNLPEDLRYEMLSMTSQNTGTEIPSLDNIDYSQFYKLDTETIASAGDWKNRLVIWVNGEEYKVIYVDGVTYKQEKIYIIIPFDNEAEPQYITTDNNTFKFYGDGTVKVVGENSKIAGRTEEENNEINGTQELNLEKINKEFGNPMQLPEKKWYIVCGTIYVIDQNDDLWAWGDNTYNKLGQGNSYLVTEPTKILEGRTEGTENVKAKNVWAGYSNTFVLDTENRLWACGTNSTGELGLGNGNIYYNFRQVTDINGENVKAVYPAIGTQNSNVFILYNDGEVYGAGVNNWGNLGIGNKVNQTRFVKISDYDSNIQNVKKVIATGTSSYLLKENGELYGCGYNGGGFLGVENANDHINWTKIADNVEDVSFASRATYKDKEGAVYVLYSKAAHRITNINADINNKLLSGRGIFSEGNIYRAGDSTTAALEVRNVQEVYGFDGVAWLVYKKDGKIQVEEFPDITKPKQKSIYNLKTIFEDAIFVQGAPNSISIVTKEGEIFEDLEKNDELSNVKKLISSNVSKYAITNDGKLYAKGGSRTGMWGSHSSSGTYKKVTKDGTNAFDNVENLFTSQVGNAAIFITTNKKIYWAGATAYVRLPNIKGDIAVVGAGNLTKYPEEVTSPVVEEIKDIIKEFEFSFINEGGINVKITYIITENGKLYTTANNINASGNGKITSDFEELTIKEGTTVKEVVTANALTLAVLSNGEVYGWGYNTYGILGDGYEVGGIYPTPVKLNLPNNIKSVSLGKGFAIFVSNTGEVYGIGRNDYGQLGTGDNKGASSFVRCEELEK